MTPYRGTSTRDSDRACTYGHVIDTGPMADRRCKQTCVCPLLVDDSSTSPPLVPISGFVPDDAASLASPAPVPALLLLLLLLLVLVMADGQHRVAIAGRRVVTCRLALSRRGAAGVRCGGSRSSRRGRRDSSPCLHGRLCRLGSGRSSALLDALACCCCIDWPVTGAHVQHVLLGLHGSRTTSCGRRGRGGGRPPRCS